MIGFLFFLLFLAGIALVFLQGQQMPGIANTNTELTDVRWKPRFIGAAEIPAATGLYVRFDVSGSVEGHGGCNSFGGSLQASDGKLRVGPLRTTKKACASDTMQMETEFLNAMQSADNIVVGNDRLSFFDQQQRLLLECASGNE